MPKIKNKLFQPLAVLLEDEKTLHLQSREEVEVGRKDLESSHLQALMKRGDIALIEEERKHETEPRSRHR
jgi:hypothetical protein